MQPGTEKKTFENVIRRPVTKWTKTAKNAPHCRRVKKHPSPHFVGGGGWKEKTPLGEITLYDFFAPPPFSLKGSCAAEKSISIQDLRV